MNTYIYGHNFDPCQPKKDNDNCVPESCCNKYYCFPGPPGPQGPPGPEGQPGEPGLSAPNADLPIVHRIMVDATLNGIRYPLVLELDRPAPLNCYLQFYRYSIKRRNRGSDRNFSFPSKYAFRGIFVDGRSNDFPVVHIPFGATVVTLMPDQWARLYKPVIVRGSSVREWQDTPEGRPRWNPVPPRSRDNKVIYKFGTCEYIRGVSFRANAMSADTLTIIRHFVTNTGIEQLIQREYLR